MEIISNVKEIMVLKFIVLMYIIIIFLLHLIYSNEHQHRSIYIALTCYHKRHKTQIHSAVVMYNLYIGISIKNDAMQLKQEFKQC